MDQTFTFDANGKYVNYQDAPGYPKDKKPRKIDTSTKTDLIDLAEMFFSQNWRDVTSKKIIEWGRPKTDKDGNRSIRCKLEATIWDKDKKIMNVIFTFSPEGKFISSEIINSIHKPKTDTPQDTVNGFTRAAAGGDLEAAMSYFLPDGFDYNDARAILTAQPSAADLFQFRQLLEATDTSSPVKIVAEEKLPDDRVKVVWLVTLRQTVKLGNKPKEMTKEAGSTFELDATLKKTEQGWLIDNF